MNRPNFFSEHSPFLQHPLLTAERTASEVDFVVSTLNLSPGARVLDVGCGFGRHSIELARRGYVVVGIDPSATMIAAARVRAAETGISVDFRQVSGEVFVTDDLFEAAICLFTTLGQISATEDNSALIPQVYQALQPGGAIIVEVPQREATVKRLKTAEKFGSGERYTTVARQFNVAGNMLTESFTVVSPAVTRHYLLRYRLYTLAELANLLTEAGFTVRQTYSDYQASPWQADSAVMLVVSSK